MKLAKIWPLGVSLAPWIRHWFRTADILKNLNRSNSWNCAIITARIQRMREGNIFSLYFQSVHTCGGGGGRTPSQVWVRVPHLRSGWGIGYPGYPPTRTGWWRGTPSQVWMVGGTRGTPWPGLDGGGVPGVPPSHQEWMGYPLPH